MELQQQVNQLQQIILQQQQLLPTAANPTAPIPPSALSGVPATGVSDTAPTASTTPAQGSSANPQPAAPTNSTGDWAHPSSDVQVPKIKNGTSGSLRHGGRDRVGTIIGPGSGANHHRPVITIKIIIKMIHGSPLGPVIMEQVCLETQGLELEAT